MSFESYPLPRKSIERTMAKFPHEHGTGTRDRIGDRGQGTGDKGQWMGGGDNGQGTKGMDN
jgi:hypothetical protein